MGRLNKHLSPAPSLESLRRHVRKAKKGNGHFQDEVRNAIKKVKNEGELIGMEYKKKPLNYGDNLKETAREFESVRKSFCKALLENLDERFPKHSTDVASAFRVMS